MAAVQISKALGLRVVGTAGTAEGVEMVRELGADFAVNHREEGYIQAIQVRLKTNHRSQWLKN